MTNKVPLPACFSAEQLSFNSAGACPTCSGTGIVRIVDRASLVPDETKSIDDGAVLPWGSLMWDLMKQVCGAMGVRTNIPFNQLTDAERDIVFNGPAIKKHILYKPKKGNDFAELDFTYFNAVYTVENALAKVKDEKGIKRVSRFLSEKPSPDCFGTRLSQQARQPQILGIDLTQATAMTLDETIRWVRSVPKSLPQEMRAMATAICESSRIRPSGSWNSDYAICRLTAQVRHCPPASVNVCSWPVRCVTALQACCMCWMNRLSDCIRRMWMDCWA